MSSGSRTTPHRVCRQIRRAALSALAVWASVSAKPLLAQDACEVDRVTASDVGLFNSFGWAVSVSNDITVIGADWDDDNGLDAGAGYVFRFDGASWVEEQKLLASDGHGDAFNSDLFGFSTAVDGDTAMVGAIGHQHPGSPGGAAYVFRYNGTGWVEEQELRPSDGAIGDGFGYSVAIRGDVALIGARTDPPGGSAYVFRYNPQTLLWVEEQKFTSPDGFGNFGYSSAIDGDVAVVGAPGAGAAYVFRFDGTSWFQEQKLHALKIPGPVPALIFGESVSVHGDAALVGARAGGPALAGAAFVFRYDPLQPPGFRWVGEQGLVPSEAKQGMQFGKSVSIHGDTALIGAWLSDLASPSHGAAYVYRFIKGSGWTEAQTLLPQPGPWSAFFGHSVGLSGDAAVVGAYGENGQAGAAYLYAGMSGVDCNTNGVSDSCDLLLATAVDANGNGIPDECECAWDLDASGDVAVNDFLDLLGQWGSNPGGPPDFDGDGTVGIVDFLDLLAHWGPCA